MIMITLSQRLGAFFNVLTKSKNTTSLCLFGIRPYHFHICSRMLSLTDLPEELLVLLSDYLNGRDLTSLSHSCSRLLRTYRGRRLWHGVFKREAVAKEDTVVQFAQKETERAGSEEICATKLSYLAHRRLRRNWRTGRHAAPVQSITLSEGFRSGHDDRHLVVMEPHASKKDTWYLRAWDLAGRGAEPLLSGGGRQKVAFDFGADFDFAPVTVLVSSGVALLSFTGRGSDTPQELVALEIAKRTTSSPSSSTSSIKPSTSPQQGGKFRQLWRDSIHDWGHFQLPNLFAGDVYKFNLLTNRIEVRQKEPSFTFPEFCLFRCLASGPSARSTLFPWLKRCATPAATSPATESTSSSRGSYRTTTRPPLACGLWGEEGVQEAGGEAEEEQIRSGSLCPTRHSARSGTVTE